MHESVRAFVMHNIAGIPPGAHILEVGSADVNGGVRDLFDGHSYTGIDHEAADGVDIVASSHDLTDLFERDTFDLVLCLEMLEHDTNPWDTIAEICEVTKPGGKVILTARGNGFPEHNRPDCFRFMRDGFRALIEHGGLTLHVLEPDPQVSGWFAVATRGVARG